MEITSPTMRPEQAARFLSLSVSTLAKMRSRGDGPPYSKLGGKIVVYRVDALADWLAQHSRVSTSK